ncbi:MAG: hypothetical protein QF512_01845 [Alphaproteobacteria bacterium]|jgi:cbb3-type cytochrome oxidase subunit 1|nr:hypothetical protein [Alphaproteobacteria bacterium]
MSNLSGWCFRLAVLYALFGMVMGEAMAMSGDHGQMPVHAHINVLGWVSLALFGVFYKLWPAAAVGRLPLAQFVLFNIGIIVQAVSVSIILSGNEAAGPFAGIGSAFLIISMALFAYLVYRHATE